MKKLLLTILLALSLNSFADVVEFKIVAITPRAFVCREVVAKIVSYDEVDSLRYGIERDINKAFDISKSITRPAVSATKKALSPELYYIPTNVKSPRRYKVGTVVRVQGDVGSTFTHNNVDFTIFNVWVFDVQTSAHRYRMID